MFEIGQMVVCVDGGWRGYPNPKRWPIMPRTGQIYTIRSVHERGNGPGVFLEEIITPKAQCTTGWDEPGFQANRFRPIRKTDISSIVEAMNRAPRELADAD